MASNLAWIRQLEAIAFRSFPATSTFYDGTWAIRLTAGHPAKRLNSVTPLDPSDTGDLSLRMTKAQRRFESFGRPLVFRLSPLAPRALSQMMDELEWPTFEESLVMYADLDELDLDEGMDLLPLSDVGKWVDAFLELGSEEASRKPGLVEIIQSISGEVGLFMRQNADGGPISVMRCVHDNELVGIFDVLTHPNERGRGHGRQLMLSGLKWARLCGARNAWLQVVASNEAAIRLYRSLGFYESYRYCYRRLPQET